MFFFLFPIMESTRFNLLVYLNYDKKKFLTFIKEKKINKTKTMNICSNTRARLRRKYYFGQIKK